MDEERLVLLRVIAELVRRLGGSVVLSQRDLLSAGSPRSDLQVDRLPSGGMQITYKVL